MDVVIIVFIGLTHKDDEGDYEDIKPKKYQKDSIA